VLGGQLEQTAGCAYRVGEPHIADVRGTSGWQVGLQGEPLLAPWVGEGCEPSPVLVVAARELDVVQDNPDVCRVELRQRG
jgi:hypothetical protein